MAWRRKEGGGVATRRESAQFEVLDKITFIHIGYGITSPIHLLAVGGYSIDLHSNLDVLRKHKTCTNELVGAQWIKIPSLA